MWQRMYATVNASKYMMGLQYKFHACSEKESSIKLIDYNSAVFFEEPTEPGGTPE